MSAETMLKIREIVSEIERKTDHEMTDIAQMTSPCGLPCFACYLYMASMNEVLRQLVASVLEISTDQASCPGCRSLKGKCAHLPMSCRVYPCTEKQGILFCSDCADFPCDLLHPFSDKAHMWHNMNVFNLCLIKKDGLHTWAKQNARNIRDTYCFASFTL